MRGIARDNYLQRSGSGIASSGMGGMDVGI